MPDMQIYNGTTGIWWTLGVPVVSPVDATDATIGKLGGNYILTDGAVPAASEEALGALQIHPDCFVFAVEAPVLCIQLAGTAGKQEYQFGSTISFIDGYNVAVAASATGVLFTGVTGGGKGLAPIDSVKEGECGLRSINGLEGNVTVAGYSQTTTSGGTITLAFSTWNEQEDEE